MVQASPARLLGCVCVLVAAAGIALREWLRSEAGTLAWNGDAWSWVAGPVPEAGTPEAVLDLQRTLLLRWSASGGKRRWLWAERRLQPSTWDALRRAVYSRARPGGAEQSA